MDPQELIQIEKEQGIDEAIDVLFRYANILCNKGRFDELDEFIKKIRVDDYSSYLLVGVLTITLAAKSKLNNRKNLFDEIAKKLDREKLLFGLE